MQLCSACRACVCERLLRQEPRPRESSVRVSGKRTFAPQFKSQIQKKRKEFLSFFE